MDFEKDYIMRMIHMLGDLMRRVLERVDRRERAEMLNSACRETCGMTLEAGEALGAQSLIDMLAPIPRLMMSELLAAKAEALELLPEEADALTLQSLRLLASLSAEGHLCELRAQRLTDLKARVLPLLNGEDLMACARFFAQAERFDEMEDALFEALPLCAAETREAARQEAILLLRQAAKAGEQSLALCHMTAHELRESARELETRPDDTAHEQENPV